MSMETMMPMIRPTRGMNNRRNHHTGRPAICTNTIMFQIGMMQAMPGFPALVKTFHIAAMRKIARASMTRGKMNSTVEPPMANR